MFKTNNTGFLTRFSKQEFSGAIGDMGTSIPLLIGMVTVCHLDPSKVFGIFGLLQIFSGIFYKIPIPVQPLKAVAALAIAQHLTGPIIFGAGLSLGILMFVIYLSGTLRILTRLTALCIIRGIQMGLGLNLIQIALKEYLPNNGWLGYGLAVLCFFLIVLFQKKYRVWTTLTLIVLGVVYTLLTYGLMMFSLDITGFNIQNQWIQVPLWVSIWDGFWLLALPQIALSICNSLLATEQLTHDLFPEKKLSVQNIAFTYSIMNIVSPFLGGVPVCHGSGGVLGHYNFGGRNGASVIIYGSVLVLFAFLFQKPFEAIIHFFPMPLLAVILFFEGLALLKLIKSSVQNEKEWTITLIVGVTSVFVPNGYLIGLIMGYILWNILGK